MSIWHTLGKGLSDVAKVGDAIINPAGAATQVAAAAPAVLAALAENPQDLIAAGTLLGQVPAALLNTTSNEAQEKVKTYEGLLAELVAEAHLFTGLADVIASCAERGDSTAAREAIKAALEEASGVTREMGKLSSADLVTLTFEVGGQVDLGVGADASAGFAAAVPDVLDIKAYASAGITAGAEEGVDLGLTIGMSPQKYDDQGGPFVAVSVSVEAALGGGLAVSFNLPDMSFGGVSVAIEAGEELQVAVGAGYSWAL